MEQNQKLSDASNQCKTGGRSVPVIIILGMLLLAGGTLYLYYRGNSAHQGEAEDKALAAANSCSLATAQLGAGIHRVEGWTSNLTRPGERGLNDDSVRRIRPGAANVKHIEMPVAGDKGAGKLRYYAEKSEGGQWHLAEVELTIGDRKVSVWPCVSD